MTAATPLSARHLNRATLARQGLLTPVGGQPAELVRRVGSLQAQHPEWPPVAAAARAADARSADVAGALERRTVVRSSLMRITIHVVAAGDLWPMFVVCQPMRTEQWRLLTKVDPRSSELGSRLMAAHRVAIAALRERAMSSLEIDRLLAAEVGLDGDAFTRPAWREAETRVPVRVAWRHFAAFVPVIHVPHEGEGYGRSRYAVAEDWLGERMPTLSQADARAHLVRRYLAAFGPASLEDLVAYVGRRGALAPWRETLGRRVGEVVTLPGDDGRTFFDLADAPRPDPATPAPPRLLARWDSLLLSHAPKARQRVIADEDRDRVFSKNGDVLPTFLVDGFVAGTWQLERVPGRLAVTLTPFRPLERSVCDALVDEAERVLALLAPRAERAVDIAT